MSDQNKQPPKPTQKLSDEIVGAIKDVVIGANHSHEIAPDQPKKSTKFQKGQSGNPKGRPKKNRRNADSKLNITALPAYAALGAILDKEFTVKSASGASEITLTGIEALIHQIYKSSNGGNAHSQKLLFEASKELQQAEQLRKLESYAFWEKYKIAKSQEINSAREAELAEPICYPDPDDIILGWPDRVNIIGPFDEQQAEKLKFVCDLRDTLMVQDILDQRSNIQNVDQGHTKTKLKDRGFDLDPCGGSLLLATFLNEFIIPRLRKALDPSDRDYLQYHKLTKRQLIPVVRQKWANIGIKVHRGFVMPSTDKVYGALLEFTDIFKVWRGNDFREVEDFIGDLREILLEVQQA